MIFQPYALSGTTYLCLFAESFERYAVLNLIVSIASILACVYLKNRNLRLLLASVPIFTLLGLTLNQSCLKFSLDNSYSFDRTTSIPHSKAVNLLEAKVYSKNDFFCAFLIRQKMKDEFTPSVREYIVKRACMHYSRSYLPFPKDIILYPLHFNPEIKAMEKAFSALSDKEESKVTDYIDLYSKYLNYCRLNNVQNDLDLPEVATLIAYL